ncbi:hypothetical protein Bca52824_052514 [Brassica carinata]|uniref:WIYLD domain-containing protein n=1 Tax=Brassica carinata TaxID=52824 RepID=A0A8X7UK02_BRACI|nr:hypothetical protein Bca52824_052514 [Brassica carinata]
MLSGNLDSSFRTLRIIVMVPKGRKKAGLTREDAARDAMRSFDVEERLITVCIRELLEEYGEEGWFLIEDCSYMVLLNKCREKSAEQGQTLAEDRTEGIAEEQNDEIAEAEQEQKPQQEEEKEQEQEQEQRVEDGRDHAGSRSTCLVGCVTETGTQTCQTKDLTITSQTDILDSSPTGVASVIDYASAEASRGFAKHIIEVIRIVLVMMMKIIQLTPEPISEELEELIKEICGEKKRKRASRWED